MNENFSKKTKHQKGSFYTPSWLVDEVLIKVKQFYEKLNTEKISNSLNIGDISCGIGNFLNQIPNFFPNSIIFGYDLDSLALETAKKSFFKRENQSNNSSTNTSTDISANFEKKNSLKSNLNGIKFDILIGNPPWISEEHFKPNSLLKSHQIYSKILRNRKKSNLNKRSYYIRDQVDIYSFFIIKNISLLKKGGILGLIIPSTLLFNPVYESLREFMLKNTILLDISYLGEGIFKDVKVPSIIIFLEKHKPEMKQMIEISFLKGKSLKFSHKIRQKTFQSNKFSNFTIFTEEKINKLIKKIENTPHYIFGDFVSNSRGVEIGKRGKIYKCPHCKKWNPWPKFKILEADKEILVAKCNLCKKKVKKSEIISVKEMIKKGEIEDFNEKDKIFWFPLIRGEDIKRFSLKSPYFVNVNYSGIKYKKSSVYKKPKILLRKTGKGIIGTIDYKNRYTLQVVYQFSLKNIKQKKLLENRKRKYSLEFLFGIISSKLIEFYYYHRFANPLKKTFPHIIQTNILALPIPIIDLKDPKIKKNYKLIEKEVGCLLQNSGKNRQRLDNLIADLFCLSIKDLQVTN